MQGELLAIDDGHVYLRTAAGVREVDLPSLREVRVRQHGWAPSRFLAWGAIAGVVSGTALTAACGSVEGNSGGGCLAVGAVFAGIWLGLSGLAALGSGDSENLRVTTGTDQALRPFARFPAGLPKDVPPQALVAGPPGPK